MMSILTAYVQATCFVFLNEVKSVYDNNKGLALHFSIVFYIVVSYKSFQSGFFLRIELEQLFQVCSCKAFKEHIKKGQGFISI